MRTESLLARRPLRLASALLAVALVAGCAAHEHEETVALDALPAAVRATFEREAKGATLAKIERETEDGKTVYEADATIDGQRYELKVDADGKLLSKEREDDEDEHEEHGEHHGAATKPTM